MSSFALPFMYGATRLLTSACTALRGDRINPQYSGKYVLPPRLTESACLYVNSVPIRLTKDPPISSDRSPVTLECNLIHMNGWTLILTLDSVLLENE